MQLITKDAAFSFMAEVTSVDKTYYWDVHCADEQRYCNIIWIFYGGNVTEHSELAEDSWGLFWMRCFTLIVT